ncbi:MAG TPA: response regulator [Xanthobacteraceae bacterium]
MPAAAALKILIVDDQMSVRTVARMSLEKIGVRLIHEAENGQQALKTASIQPLDLIISDFNMPEMDGLALLRAVRGHPALRKTPFILVTGRGDRELVIKAAQAGVNNYLVKPFDQATLQKKMEEVLGRIS